MGQRRPNLQTRLLIGRKLHWAEMMPCGTWAPNGPKVKGPTVVRAVNSSRDKMGKELAHLPNGPIIGLKSQRARIGPTAEWAEKMSKDVLGC